MLFVSQVYAISLLLFKEQDLSNLCTFKTRREYFGIYADTCFANFGDRVKNWATLNEPVQTSIQGYCYGTFAPGRNESSETEPYLVAHHQLLAHATAYSIYESKYKV